MKWLHTGTSRYQILFLFLLSIAICFLFSEAEAASALKDSRYSISLLTMDPGEELFARFGHNILVVEDRQKGTKKAYNFGTFNFSDPALRAKYIRGDLEYWLEVSTYSRMIYIYRHLDRHLVEQFLDLTDDQAEFIAGKLEINARPENRKYMYRHYHDNCCTRIRDLLNEATDGAIIKGRNSEPTGRTFRDWTRPALTGMPIMRTLILFILGPTVDRPITRWQEMFLPSVLSEDLDKIRIGPDQRPLVRNKQTVLSRQGPPIGSKTNGSEIIFIAALFGSLILAFGLPIFLSKRPLSARLTGVGLIIWGLLAGLGGLVLVIISTVTLHYDGHNNENLMVMPIVHLWLLGPGVKLLFTGRLKKRTSRWIGNYLLIAMAFLIIDLLLKLGPFIQSNYGFIAFAAACNLAGLLALYRSGL